MSKRAPEHIRRFIAEAAISQVKGLPQEDQAVVFEEVSKLLPHEQAEQAKLVAFSIRQTEARQMKLTQLLKESQS